MVKVAQMDADDLRKPSYASSIEEAQALIRQCAEPRPAGDQVKAAVRRASRRLDLPFSLATFGMATRGASMRGKRIDSGRRHQKGEIIELGMVKFDYLPDGRVVGPRNVFASFNEPSGPIPARSPPSPASRRKWSLDGGSTRRPSPRSWPTP
jgi:hypothetical protein